MTPAEDAGELFDRLTTYLVALADEVGFQVDLADLDPVCGIGSSQVLDWATTGARHAALAYQRHLLAAPIAFLKQDPDGAHDPALADLLYHDRRLDWAQEATRRRYTAACAALSRLRLGLIWPHDDTPDPNPGTTGSNRDPDGLTDALATGAEDHEPATTETGTDHGHSR